MSGTTETDCAASQSIAIVGLAGRFPQARNCDEFWANLVAGRECLSRFNDSDIVAAGHRLDAAERGRVRSRGVVAGADQFDAGFFGYSPREAEVMDPQQRVFLELAWEALEHASIDPQRPPGPVGVFAGCSINTYYLNNVSRRPDVLATVGMFPAVLLGEKDFLATRVAYKLDLRGPALSVQTACSTSLVAVCNACQSLLNFECDVALAGGVMLNFPSCHSVVHEEGGMIAADGHCRPFDRDATGTLFSDGAGVVVLRRLDDALAAGDNVLAVIRGFALNNDGADKAGYTAPSVNGQARVVQMALAFGDIAPDTISYVEAHGTATPLGDPIEIAALTQAFRAGTDRRQYCAIGSAKSNLGHLDVAAGVAGLIKTVLALQHRQIPPSINYSAPNPKIDFTSTPFYVADRLLDWTPPAGVPRRAGVSSFGIGGTNAHVVLEEAPPAPNHPASRAAQLLVLSGKSTAAVTAAARQLAAHLRDHPQVALADVAFTLQTGRQGMIHRRSLVADSVASAIVQLESDTATAPVNRVLRRGPPVVFMFPGQGSQRVNMGRELYEREAEFREIVDRCALVLQPHLGLDIRGVLYPAADRVQWAEAQLVQTRITQPALFVTEYALAALWISWGVMPAAMIGHSVGEYVAACLAGVMSLDDGLRLIAARGRLIQAQPAGSMLVVMGPEASVQPLLPRGVGIAAVNAPSMCVVSGPQEAIAALDRELQGKGLATRPLRTSHAFHSAMMDPVIEPFMAELRQVRLNAPSVPYVSNVHGGWISAQEATSAEYWCSHLRQAVRFADGVATLLARAEQVLLEVGPGTTLAVLAGQHPTLSPHHVVVSSLPMGRDQAGDVGSVLAALGRMWQAGLEPEWEMFHGADIRQRVPLPTYPFERKRFFIEPAAPSPVAQLPAQAMQESPLHPASPEGVDGSTSRIDRRRRRQAIKAQVIARVSELSGLPAGDVDADATFQAMGFDSLFLSRLSHTLELVFGQPVGLGQLMADLGSPAALSSYLDIRLPEGWGQTQDDVPATGIAGARVAPVAGGTGELRAIQEAVQSLGEQVQKLTEALLAPDHPLRAQKTAPSAAAPSVGIPPDNVGLETSLCRIFASVLGREKVGANDDFFRSGGGSLEAVVVVARIRQELSLGVSALALMQHPTASALAAALTGNPVGMA